MEKAQPDGDTLQSTVSKATRQLPPGPRVPPTVLGTWPPSGTAEVAAKSQCRMMSDRHCMASVQLLGGEGHEHRGTHREKARPGSPGCCFPLQAKPLQSRFPDQGAAAFCSEM